MIKLKLNEIIQNNNVIEVKNLEKFQDKQIEKVFIDTRKIDNGENGIFFCIEGQNFDGHDFIENAIQKSVPIVVVSNQSKIPYCNDCCFIVVRNTVEFLGNLAKLVIEKKRKLNRNFKVIAVAGSAGKTTTKNILKYLMKFVGFRVVASEKNFNNEIGVPLTIFQVNEDTEMLILEMGMRGFDQIKYLCSISDPDYGIITSIGPEHLEFVNNIKGVIKAETELTEFLKNKNRYFIIPNKIKKLYLDYHNFDYMPNSKYFIKKINFDLEKIATYSSIAFGEKYLKLKIQNIISKTTIFNFLISLKILQKIDDKKLDVALNHVNGIILDSLEKDRFYFENINSKIFIINDFYNSNYLSLSENLKAIEKISSKFERTVLFLGDMLELGKYSIFYHNKILSHLLNYSHFEVHLIGSIFSSLKDKMKGYNFEFYESVDDLIKQGKTIQSIVKYGNKVLVFIKGSRMLRLERIYEEIKSCLL